MKSLNLNKHLLDKVDNILWQNNPFYCQPSFQTCKNGVSFRNMCEAALTFLADVCVQRYYSSSKLVDRKLNSSVEDLSYSFEPDFNIIALIDDSSFIKIGDEGKFEQTINLKDIKSFVSGVAHTRSLPSFNSSLRSDRCSCDCHQADIFVLRSDGNLFFNVNRSNTQPNSSNDPNQIHFFDNILTDLGDLLIVLSAESSKDALVDLQSFYQEFMSVFKEFDSFNIFDEDNLTRDKNENCITEQSFELYKKNHESCLVLIPCDKVQNYLAENSSFDGFSDLNSIQEFTELNDICSTSQSSISILEHKDTMKNVGRKADLLNQSSSKEEHKHSPAVLETNLCLPDINPSKNDSNLNKSCVISELSIKENILPRDESNGSEQRWKRIARYFEPTDLERINEGEVLPTVPEEEELRSIISETGDIVNWKEMLWESVLDYYEDDWFQATSLGQHKNIDQWFSSTDNEGRVYFFEENTNKSSWTLPENEFVNNNEIKSSDFEPSNSSSNTPLIEKGNRYKKSKSMILGRTEESSPVSNLAHNWPQLTEGTMCILKEGPLNKTKITSEKGKKVRKNWTSTYAVLTELQLLFFKDNKGFSSMMSGQGQPELSVDLNGALIDPGVKKSSRKNVFILNTFLGLQVLIQSDCVATTDQWVYAIQAAINNLPSSFDGQSPRAKSESLSGADKARFAISRSKSLLKYKSASIEDISINVAERQTKIKERLKKFFIRRPTVEQLVKKGIWKDEAVFGCLLENVSPNEAPRVPEFVQECIRCIESSEENMKTDGLYRASGNLSQVQKIRLQVDQNIYTLLRVEDDVHVLGGTLKLFFRELKQPLIPFKFFKKALNASTNQNRKEKIEDFRGIVGSLPPCNKDTLKFLLQHLLRVTEYQEFNRMHIPNIAIVFGPTLMWPEQESLNMAFDLMQQNLVIECFLSEFNAIFS